MKRAFFDFFPDDELKRLRGPSEHDFKSDEEVQRIHAIAQSDFAQSNLDTPESLADFLKTIDPAAASFWLLVYQRIGLPYPIDQDDAEIVGQFAVPNDPRRLLEEDQGPRLADILDDQQRAGYKQALSRTKGLILAVGPTSSGKNALLFHGMRMLNRLRGEHVPMATVEWTPRGRLDGAIRVVVSHKNGVTFGSAVKRLAADGTRAFLVGEIHDFEIAEEAVYLTTQRRRLILSTLHVEDAPCALQRLCFMGVPPEAVGESVVLVFALRAVRKLCDDCKHPICLPPPALRAAGFEDDETSDALILWEPNREGCSSCTKGFQGQYYACQMMPMSDALRATFPTAALVDIRRVAMREGMKPLRRILLDAAKAGKVWLADVRENN